MNATLCEQLIWHYNLQPQTLPKVTAQDCEPFIFFSYSPRHHDRCEEVCDGINHYSIVMPVIYICDGAYESRGETVIEHCYPCDGSCRQPMPEDDDGIGCNRLAGEDFVELIANYLAQNQVN